MERRTRKYVKGSGFLSFSEKCKKQLLGTWLDSLKTASKKVVHKGGEFLGNKTADAVTKSNDDKTEKPKKNSKNVEEIIILLEKRDKIKQIEKSIIKMEHYKISKLLNDSTVSKFATKNGSK